MAQGAQQQSDCRLASSSLTAAGGQAMLDYALITELLNSEGLTLGLAIQRTKATVHPLALRRT